MDELVEKYQNLKISAFDKVKQVNSSIHNVTIGPNSYLEDNLEPVQNKNNNFKKTTIKTSVQGNPSLFSVRKYFMVKEMQRVEDVQKAIMFRQKQIIEQQQMQDERMKSQWLTTQKNLLLRMKQQEMQIFQTLEEHDKNLHIQNEQQQQYYLELEEKRRKKEMQAKEQIQRDLQYMEKITKNQKNISLVYQDILEILKSNTLDENKKSSILEISQQLKSVITEIEEITKKCKVCVTLNEVQKSTDLLEKILILKDKVQNVIDESNKQKEINLNQQQIQDIKEEKTSTPAIIATNNENKKPKIENVTTKIDKFVSKMSFRYYSELQDFLQKHEKSYENLLADEGLKQFKFDCKKAVNIPVNAISSVNSQHLLDKYNKLSNLLSGKPVQVGDSQVSAAHHPQGIAFCMDLLAKKFILQGDLTISSNPEAAFCYATIILSLWNDFPDFGKLLLAHFHKECPYLVPIYFPKAVGQSDSEYYESLGYRYSDGVVEKQDKFLKRMTGVMRLYCAIMIAKPKKSQKCIHPHGLSQGWRWLTAMLNLEPRTDITATLLHVFLETIGSEMQNTYRKEFKKIITFIETIYMAMLKKIDSGGPFTRLEVLLQDYRQKGYFTEPSGVLSTNYW